MWRRGDRLRHRFNDELGPGRVVEADDRFVEVEFPHAEATMRFAAGTDALVELSFAIGDEALLEETGERVRVAEDLGEARLRLEDGRVVVATSLWPLRTGSSLAERLERGRIDPIDEFSTRLEAMHLEVMRRADGLGSFLGGRIELFPHQLHVAEKATRADPVRWLLADEVGLGKTVEACLILNHLVRTGRADSALVVAPDTLTVQWLGELWRKFHQVFSLIDAKRLNDVEKEFGRGFNPFDAHRQVVVGMDLLLDQPHLAERAAEAGFDLLVVDEAHRLERPPGHPGNREWRLIEPLARACPHALLLTATPLAEDAHGFLRLVQLLRPEDFPDEFDADARIASGEPLPECVSSTRRANLLDLPPRVPKPVDLPGGEAIWAARRECEEIVRAMPDDDALKRKRKAELWERALSSGPALAAKLPARDETLRPVAERLSAQDPRVAWLTDQAGRWRDDGEKTLVFVAERDTLEMLREELSRRAQVKTGVFHEDLSPAQRDIEVAHFRLEGGPSLLVSTECGGEGRNFQFCTRIVLFDLPWNPMTIEQRIGRLDRIGRTMPVEIVYFRDPGGFERHVVDALERVGLFTEPLGGLEPELLDVRAALVALAASGGADSAARAREHLAASIAKTHGARERVRSAAWDALHREPYRREMAPEILARVPDELEELTEDVITERCQALRMRVEELRGERRHAIEFGTEALMESLPGVAPGSSYLGTFDRTEAVEAETEDFFASGHPLVEGVLAQLDEDEGGRVALLHVAHGDEHDLGVAAFHLGESGVEVECVDTRGRPRPDWARTLAKRPLRTRRVKPEAWVEQEGWAGAMRRMTAALDTTRPPIALAAVRFSPSR